MTFTIDTKNAAVLIGDSRNANATFLYDLAHGVNVRWMDEMISWASESRKWSETVAQSINLDTRS